MSAIEDIKQLLQDFLTPELRAVTARLDAVERLVEANERRAEKRHEEVMQAIRQVSDYTAVINRLSQLEARVNASEQPSH
jgi:tetrahydromethanopterin S-methyltransferase subunit G